MLWTTFNRIKDIIETYSDIRVKLTKHKRYHDIGCDDDDGFNMYTFKPKYSLIFNAPAEKVRYCTLDFLTDFKDTIPNFNQLKVSDILELFLLGTCKTVNFDNFNDEDKPLSLFNWINTALDSVEPFSINISEYFITTALDSVEPFSINISEYFITTDAYRMLKSIGIPSSLEELNIKLDLLDI